MDIWDEHTLNLEILFWLYLAMFWLYGLVEMVKSSGKLRIHRHETYFMTIFEYEKLFIKRSKILIQNRLQFL